MLTLCGGSQKLHQEVFLQFSESAVLKNWQSKPISLNEVFLGQTLQPKEIHLDGRFYCSKSNHILNNIWIFYKTRGLYEIYNFRLIALLKPILFRFRFFWYHSRSLSIKCFLISIGFFRVLTKSVLFVIGALKYRSTKKKATLSSRSICRSFD